MVSGFGVGLGPRWLGIGRVGPPHVPVGDPRARVEAVQLVAEVEGMAAMVGQTTAVVSPVALKSSIS